MWNKYVPQSQVLQIEACTTKLFVKTRLTQEGNFELTLQIIIVHVDQAVTNN
jgi:hypothetical protein